MCSEIEETFKMIEEEADRLREERRAKMKEIKENMSNGLWREGKGPSIKDIRFFGPLFDLPTYPYLIFLLY